MSLFRATKFDPGRRALFQGRIAAAAPISISASCLAKRRIVCRSCAETCEPAAISFALRPGEAPQPRIDLARCTSCGECAAACPASAIVIVKGDRDEA